MAIDLADYNSRIAERTAEQSSQIRQNIQGREALIKKVYIDLNTARDIGNAIKISIPFKSVVVEAASDTTAYLNIGLGDNTISGLLDAKILKSNDSFDFEAMISSGFLWWPAQSGKFLTLVFSTTGSFKPGSQISVLSGGVTILDGSGLSDTYLGASSNASSIAIAAAATLILPADTNRKSAELYLNGGDIRLGGSAITVAKGVPRFDGTVWEYRSTAALYGFLSAGAPTVTGIVYT